MKTNILSINDSSPDIHYKRSAITGNFNIDKKRREFDDKFAEFLEAVHNYDKDDLSLKRSSVHWYSDVKDLYENFGFKYYIEDIDDLAILGYFNLNDITDMIDFSKYLSIIDKSGNEINVNTDNLKNGIFLKITYPEMIGAGNEILLYIPEKHYQSNDKMQWSTEYKKVTSASLITNPEMLHDGYKSTLEIINNSSNNNNQGAAEYCYNITVDVNGKHYRGYLPSIGQIVTLKLIEGAINHLLIRAELSPLTTYLNIWTSTEITKNSVATITPSGYCVYSKSNWMYASPFFKEL